MGREPIRWAPGTEVATVKLWDHIDQNPGCTVDDLVKMAAEDGSIPIGARRMYAKSLSRFSRAEGRALENRHPRDVDPAKAIRHLVVQRLGHMRRWGSVRRDEDGRYFTVRPISRKGIGALAQPREDVRADMAERNALIAFGRYRDKHPDGKSFMPVALFKAMSTWHDAVRRDYFEEQARRNGD